MTYASCLLAFVKHMNPKVAPDLPIFYTNFSPIQISDTGEGNKTKHSFNQLFCMGVTHTHNFTECCTNYRFLPEENPENIRTSTG